MGQRCPRELRGRARRYKDRSFCYSCTFTFSHPGSVLFFLNCLLHLVRMLPREPSAQTDWESQSPDFKGIVSSSGCPILQSLWENVAYVMIWGWRILSVHQILKGVHVSNRPSECPGSPRGQVPGYVVTVTTLVFHFSQQRPSKVLGLPPK